MLLHHMFKHMRWICGAETSGGILMVAGLKVYISDFDGQDA